MELASQIATLFSGFMDFILFVIAIYTFYLTFISNKIAILSCGFSFGMWKSDTINFFIKNMTLKTIMINKVYAVIDNKYRLEIKKNETPQILLEPRKSVRLEMEQYSRMEPTMLELSKIFEDSAKIHLEIITDEDKTIYATLRGCKKYKPDKRTNTIDVSVFSSTLNGIVVKDDYLYALFYRIGETDKVETAFINNAGLISTNIFGFNVIPKENLSNIEEIYDFFKQPCEKFHITINIQDLRKMTSRYRKSTVNEK